MQVVHFGSANSFRSWLAKNCEKKDELWLGFYKKSSKKKGITYPEALDEALCYGWIDGVRHSVNSDSYKIRFTPRQSKSVWSLVNVRHVERLKRLSRMTEAGLRAFAKRDEQRTGIYAFEQKRKELSSKYKRIFRANHGAWEFYSGQAPWYQRTTGHWVCSAKQEETRMRRLKVLMENSANGRRIPQLTPKVKRAGKTTS